MKAVRVFMIHRNVYDVATFIAYLKLEPICNDIEFVWDDENPDYVISTEHIYSYYESFQTFKRLYSKDRINIYVGTEYVLPDFNVFDYATGFYNDLICGDRYTQILTPDIFYSRVFVKKDGFVTLSKEEAKLILKNKTGFCNFLYSNSKAHPNRDAFFYLLSKYKRVDSLGRWLNNVEKAGTGFEGHANECVAIKSPYKFSIAFENAIGKGYTTEKILTSIQAHTVPIYWGNPDVERLINPKAFINCHDFNSFDDVIERVKEIDADDDLWCDVISQPWVNEENLAYAKKRNDAYYNFWLHIFNQTYNHAHRLAVGSHPNNYIKWFRMTRPYTAPNAVVYNIKKIKHLLLK